VSEINDRQLPDFVSEIIQSEHGRASTIAEDDTFTGWVQAFRRKYIVNGLLMPLYALDGRYSRSRQRVNEFGSYIMPWEMQGTVFHGVSPGWIRNEDGCFWSYLVDGQETVRSDISLPDMLRIDGSPASLVWQEIITVTKELNLCGEAGGGIIITPHALDEDYMAKTETQTGWQEGEDGYMESYRLPGTPLWISMFQDYEVNTPSPPEIEMRPAWFHLANYVFYNVPIQRLPIFCCLYTEELRLDTLRFLTDSLSDRARDFIGKSLLTIPMDLKRRENAISPRRERQEMAWWLWRNVGHREHKRILSYGEIADITMTPRSSVQTAVARFARRLKDELDNNLLERLLLTSRSLGLGYNLTYNTLVNQGLAPAREREIDDFDDITKLM